MHWRPQGYWPAGTKVTVEAKVYGRNLGGGLYGQEDRSASFTIGRSKIAIADSKTHRMKVYIDGKQITKINGRDVTTGIPISMGKDGGETGATGRSIDFRTSSGPHVVTHEARGLPDDVGQLRHHRPRTRRTSTTRRSRSRSGSPAAASSCTWPTGTSRQHGEANTSHGCINVAPAYIYWFYDTVRRRRHRRREEHRRRSSTCATASATGCAVGGVEEGQRALAERHLPTIADLRS